MDSDDFKRMIPSTQTIANIRVKHPNSIILLAVFDEKVPCNKKYHRIIVSRDYNMQTFVASLRTRFNIDKRQAIFLFSDSSIIALNQTIGEFFDKYSKSQGYVTLFITVENTFGCGQ
jgi:hypothetical protein